MAPDTVLQDMVTELLVILEAIGVPGVPGTPVPPGSVVAVHTELWGEVPAELYALAVKLYVVLAARPVAVKLVV